MYEEMNNEKQGVREIKEAEKQKNNMISPLLLISPLARPGPDRQYR